MYRGSNQFDCVFPEDGTIGIVLMPAKFNKLLWIRRGEYVIVERRETAGEKIFGTITHILYPHQIRHLRSEGLWCAFTPMCTACYEISILIVSPSFSRPERFTDETVSQKSIEDDSFLDIQEIKDIAESIEGEIASSSQPQSEEGQGEGKAAEAEVSAVNSNPNRRGLAQFDNNASSDEEDQDERRRAAREGVHGELGIKNKKKSSSAGKGSSYSQRDWKKAERLAKQAKRIAEKNAEAAASVE